MGKHINNDELKDRVVYYTSKELTRRLTPKGKASGLKIMSLLDEIRHLLNDYLPEVVDNKITYDKVVAGFSDEEWKSMSKPKKLKANDILQKELKSYVDNIQQLFDIAEKNRKALELHTEPHQDRFCEIAEMSMMQLDLRYNPVVDTANLSYLVRFALTRSGITLSEYAKKAGVPLKKLEELDTGTLARVEDLEKFANKVLAPTNNKVTVMFKVDNLDEGDNKVVRLL